MERNSIFHIFALSLYQYSHLCKDMKLLIAKIKRDLPLRISLMIVFAMALLLTVTLLIMLRYSRQAMKDDALNRANYTLDRVTLRIDNLMLGVEETVGNVYFNMKYDDPERMHVYAQKIVESNPYITGCAIAFKPGFYKDRDLYMAYAHRIDSTHQNYDKAPIEHADTFGTKPYYRQIWFTRTMEKGKALWLNPLAGMRSDIEPLTAVCAPITGNEGETVGVICAFISTGLLSDIIAAAKPSPHSYCALVDRHGSFIVDPTAGYLTKIKAVELPGESLQNAVKSMMSGQKGYIKFELNTNNFYLFYKPFILAEVPYRSINDLGWSIGIVFSEEDIFGEYNALFNYVLIIAIAGMLFMYLFTRLVIRHRLKPLKQLTHFTERIAQGHYDEPAPTGNRHHDEIGMLQKHFQEMQRTVSANINELHELTDTIQERSKELHEAYQQAKKADHMKTVFLHNMTDQMLDPTFDIEKNVTALSQYHKGTSPQSVRQLVDDIQEKGNTITQILNNLINLSEEEMNQEEGGES